MPKARYNRDARVKARAVRHALSSPSAALFADALVTTPGRIAGAEVIVANRLVDLGVTPEDVARVMGSTEIAVKRALARRDAAQTLYDGATDLAKHWLRAAAVAADEGKHQPAMEALQAIEAVARPEAAGGRGGGITVNVGVALPGTPGAPLCSQATVSEGESRA